MEVNLFDISYSFKVCHVFVLLIMNLVIQDTSLLRVLVNEDENQAHLNA